MADRDEFRLEMLEDGELAAVRLPGPRLEITQREAFTDACDRALASPAPKIVVDLSRTDRIFSLFIGSLVDLHVRAERVGKRLTLLVSPAVRESLGRMGLDRTLDLVDGE